VIVALPYLLKQRIRISAMYDVRLDNVRRRQVFVSELCKDFFKVRSSPFIGQRALRTLPCEGKPRRKPNSHGAARDKDSFPTKVVHWF